MNVSLTPELEKYIEAKVKTGRYSSSSEVVRQALRWMEQQELHEAERAKQLQQFREELDRRLAEADAGDLLDGEEVFARLREKSRLRRAKSA